jgi:O-antigen biosynthesis protein
MVEIYISNNHSITLIKIILEDLTGLMEPILLDLPLNKGRITKRLIYAPKWFQRVRIEPIDDDGEFTAKHLRLVWLPPWFAHDRLAQRLVNMHHLYRGQSKSQALNHIKQVARSQGVHWRQLALEHYEQTFEKNIVITNYQSWLAKQVLTLPHDLKPQLLSWKHLPLVSIVLPVHNPKPDHLRQCINSVLNQHYSHWQLCIADDASASKVKQFIAELAAKDPRVEVVYRPRNGHICEASNTALEIVKGEFVALLDHDDCLTPDALFQVVKALQTQPDAGLLYSDEDKINDAGERFEPHFKPQWNPDLLLAQNYLSHLGVYRTSLVREVGGFREGFEGSQDHDLALRISRRLRPHQVVHIPHVLYHWRATAGSTALNASAKTYTSQAGLKAVQDHMANTHPTASVSAGQGANTYRIHWPLPQPAPLVSLLVPTRDKLEVLQPCVDALLQRTSYAHFELLILDNQSTCSQTLAYMKEVAVRDPRVRVLPWNHAFNYSAINNFGVAQARGSIIGLVNNDIEPINPDWLDEMVRQVCRPDIGCVGAKLYYPNDTIQHAGVVLGIGGVAGHSQKYFSRNANGYFGRLHLAHNVSAVTGACLLVRKAVFQEVGGLDEANLKVSFNDVDFCLKVREAGYRNLFTPYAELYHHESISRGPNDTRAKRAVADAEAQFMRQKWGKLLDNDPYYNPNLTLVFEDFSLR